MVTFMMAKQQESVEYSQDGVLIFIPLPGLCFFTKYTKCKRYYRRSSCLEINLHHYAKKFPNKLCYWMNIVYYILFVYDGAFWCFSLSFKALYDITMLPFLHWTVLYHWIIKSKHNPIATGDEVLPDGKRSMTGWLSTCRVALPPLLVKRTTWYLPSLTTTPLSSMAMSSVPTLNITPIFPRSCDG